MTGDCPGVGADHCMAAAASLLTDVHVTVSPLVTALHCWAQLEGGSWCWWPPLLSPDVTLHRAVTTIPPLQQPAAATLTPDSLPRPVEAQHHS